TAKTDAPATKKERRGSIRFMPSAENKRSSSTPTPAPAFPSLHINQYIKKGRCLQGGANQPASSAAPRFKRKASPFPPHAVSQFHPDFTPERAN
ncbi:MAG: hypothetical protein IJ174_02240, partial [Clostridia bacterium]|nr:hypothetical protein [Clostridia bacterium]